MNVKFAVNAAVELGIDERYSDEPVAHLHLAPRMQDGDGGLLMHAQELETVQRHDLPILLCILNDGAYGSEIHKLRSDW